MRPLRLYRVPFIRIVEFTLADATVTRSDPCAIIRIRRAPVLVDVTAIDRIIASTVNHLIAGCRSKWLKHFAAMLRVQTARYRHRSIRSRHAPSRDIAKEHEEIVRAVLARDADRACALLSEHFAVTARLVLDDVDQGPSRASKPKHSRQRVES